MPHPIWMSIILLIYAGLTILIGLLAIIVRVFKVQPQSERLAVQAQNLINLKKIFGWTAIGLFLFQFVYSGVLPQVESKVSKDEFNVLAWVFFLLLVSAFYMLALWFLAWSLARSMGTGEKSKRD